jgi:4-hydroxybenzoate polyprenyltransferase
MNKIVAFFKLVRWPNLLITALMMCLVYHCIMHLETSATFFLLVISMVLVQAGGYVINDIFDKDIDAINKPEKQIVGKDFTERQCHIFYIALTIIGVVCALVDTRIFACMVLLACLLYSYSSRYKKKLIIGNVIVSLSVAFAVFVPWLYEMLYVSQHDLLMITLKPLMQISLRIVLIYTAFAFITTLIREIVKDMEDVKGDESSNCRTIPISWGIKAAQIIVLVLVLLAFIMIMYAKEDLHDLGFKTASYMLNASGIFMFMLVFGGNIFGLLDASFRTPKQFHLQSVAMKISMLIGVLSMLFIK